MLFTLNYEPTISKPVFVATGEHTAIVTNYRPLLQDHQREVVNFPKNIRLELIHIYTQNPTQVTFYIQDGRFELKIQVPLQVETILYLKLHITNLRAFGKS